MAENPLLEFGAHEAPGRAIFAGEQGKVGGEEDFARAKVIENAGDFGGLHLGDAEFAGGKIDVGHGRAGARARDGRQVVVLARAHQVGVHGGAGRHHARDFALHQRFSELGVFHLVADGHAVALLDEARDVSVGRVVGHAAHGNGGALFLVARGEGDFEFARGHHGVFEKQLVEIAQAEHQQGVGNLLLDAVVLPHQRGGGVGGHQQTVTRKSPGA